MDFDCSVCGEPLEEPGALAFSPPWLANGLCEKFHVCKSCWFSKVRKVLRGETSP